MKLFMVFFTLAFLFIATQATGTDDNSIDQAAERGYYPYKRAGLGDFCGLKRKCRFRFMCESHVCKYKVGDRCNKAPKLCPKGSICVGKKKKKCVIPGGLGATCGYTKFGICKSGLVCRKYECSTPKIPLGGNCHPPSSVCENGLVCAKKNGMKKCIRFRFLGEKCDVSPFFVCKGSLVCSGGVCKYPKVPEGGECTKPGLMCQDGLVCAGKKYYKKCVRVRGPGEKCKLNPFSICKEGLKCAGGICKTKENESCLPKGSVCLHDLVCVGRPDKKTCVRPRGVGEQCGTNPFRVCKEGLNCIHYVCRKPKVPEGGSCKAAGSVCQDGLVCVRRFFGKICFRPRGLGEKCRPNRKPCAKDFVCRRGRCRKPVIPVGGNCLYKGAECVKGSVCIGTPYKKTCVKPSRLGDACGTPFKFCKGRLLCLDHKCVKPRRNLGERCGGKVRCKWGLDCKFLKFFGNGFCVKVVGKKKTCGRFYVCRKGLKCRHGKCYYW